MKRPLWTLALIMLAAVVPPDCHIASPGTGPGRPAASIATGSRGGVYNQYGAAFQAAAGQRLDGGIQVRGSTGSLENLHMLVNGEVSYAFAAADAAAEAYAGSGEFPAGAPLRAVARLYDDYIHLVVARGSPVQTVADLRGKRVSIGADGSGTALIAQRMFEVSGFARDLRDVRVYRLGLQDSALALAQGRIDAFVWSGGLPTSAITALAGEMPIRLIDLGTVASAMRKRFGAAYRVGSMPAGTYPGLDDAVPTLAVPNLLVTTTRTPPADVQALTAALFACSSAIGQTVPVAAQLNPQTAIFTEPVPLDAGALEYYRSTKPVN